MLSNSVKRLFEGHIKCSIRTTSVRLLSAAKDVSCLTKPTENIKGEYDVIIAGGGMVGCTLACAMDAMISFSSSELLDDDVAYIVENDVLLHAVNKELLSSKSNVNIVYDAKIAGYQLPNEDDAIKSYVQMANGDTYTCQLLVKKNVDCVWKDSNIGNHIACDHSD
ncbi:hypothetical protein HF086_003421 [Spodoptera exigua]|uniref:Uncharacterized protein n=1 Tax=Spodoptera exigua TaxID=7107 RepID=A0A922SGZ4_SPOEX|nr:hypothetical protein HF086_003421 [Spodoptera exigua]